MVLRPGLDLRCGSSWCTECGDSLFHHVNESGELGRFSLGNGSCCWCGGACVVKSEGEGQYHAVQTVQCRGFAPRYMNCQGNGQGT